MVVSLSHPRLDGGTAEPANPWDLQKVLLGSWERGQEYINDIITNLNHWSTGWVDWNLGNLSLSV